MWSTSTIRRRLAVRSRKSFALYALLALGVYWIFTRLAGGEYRELGLSSARSKPSPVTSSDTGFDLEMRDYDEQALHDQFQRDHQRAGRDPTAGAIYGNTLASLQETTRRRSSHEAALSPAGKPHARTLGNAYLYNPYPRYADKENAWVSSSQARFVPCDGPNGMPVDNIMVFKGTPSKLPKPSFGSYEVLEMDPSLCFERATRLGEYGYSDNSTEGKKLEDWDKISWGRLQEECLARNRDRFNKDGHQNVFLDKPYGHWTANRAKKRTPKEDRSALLLRTYTGKEYHENDKQVIRSLVSELSLRTGGQYQVFLLVHVKDRAYDIWGNQEVYEWVLNHYVPSEFRDMAILWNDDITKMDYPKLTNEQRGVDVSQWLSVQRFSQEFPEFEYIWNWEIDSRLIGHNYEFIEKLAKFAKKQPRKGLWERNERFYIPSVHGDYNTEFRSEVENLTKGKSIWGPPALPFVKPVGPVPPVDRPQKDNYEWGVGEEADLITLSPIFDPVNSGWVARNDVWGYSDSSHPSRSLPRRATIVTQSRLSKRLLDIMHVENLRGNHLWSEMAPQTVALLHSLKAVYAPMPIFFDRPWTGMELAKWFNGGIRGESGGFGSAMGWGREGRFQGSTWYFRANPPQRLYNNWMGWEDTGFGGPRWELLHGRPCLPPILLHPIKDAKETPLDYKSESNLPYDSSF